MKAIRILLFSLCCITAAYVSATSGAAATPAATTKYFGEEFADAQRALLAKPAEEPSPTF